MDLRRPTRLVASLLTVALLLAATPVFAAPAADGAVGWGVSSWLQQMWARFADGLATWTAPNGEGIDPNGLRSVTAANGEQIDPNGTPTSSTTSSPAPLTGSSPKGVEPGV